MCILLYRQSLSLRRPKVLSTVAWNVYVLVKKPITDMIKQFVSHMTGMWPSRDYYRL